MTRELDYLSKLYDMWRHRLLYENQDLRILITGPTGMGKSWRGLDICSNIDKKFKVNQVILNPYDFMDAVRNLHPGSMIMGDEAGIWAGRRDWYTVMNKLISKTFQTVRYKNFGFCLTIPSLGLLDGNIVALFHYYIEVVFIDVERDSCKCKIMKIQHNHRTGETYFKYPRIKINGQTYVVKYVWIPRPKSQKLIDAYEKKKAGEMDEFYKEESEDMLKRKERASIDWSKPRDNAGHLKAIMMEPEKFISEYGGRAYIDSDKVGEHCGVGSSSAGRIKKMAESNNKIQTILIQKKQKMKKKRIKKGNKQH